MNKLEKVSISGGNRKMGEIPSVSLPPIITCRCDAPCIKKCYAVCHMHKPFPNVRKAYDRNLRILKEDRDGYFTQIEKASAMSRFFRWHVSGDIVDDDYLFRMVRIAIRNDKTEYLCFTKRYEMVNQFIDDFGELPSNLHILFSGWGDFDVPNPHNLPMSQVVFKGEEPKDDWKTCGGNCAECGCRGVGCWQLGKGETIAFDEH